MATFSSPIRALSTEIVDESVARLLRAGVRMYQRC